MKVKEMGFRLRVNVRKWRDKGEMKEGINKEDTFSQDGSMLGFLRQRFQITEPVVRFYSDAGSPLYAGP